MATLSSVTVGMFQTNCYFVSDPDAPACARFIVDAGGEYDDYEDFVTMMNSAFLDAPPQAVVLTHGHLDHLSLLPLLARDYPGIKVYIHEADAGALGAGGYDYHTTCFGNMQLKNWVRLVREKHGALPEPTALLHDGDALPFAPAWKVLHTPGHTPGSVCLYNEAGSMLLSGDTIFQGTCGRTDLFDGDPARIRKSIGRLLTLPPETRVLSGHGEGTTIGAERETYRVLKF